MIILNKETAATVIPMLKEHDVVLLIKPKMDDIHVDANYVIMVAHEMTMFDEHKKLFLTTQKSEQKTVGWELENMLTENDNDSYGYVHMRFWNPGKTDICHYAAAMDRTVMLEAILTDRYTIST